MRLERGLDRGRERRDGGIGIIIPIWLPIGLDCCFWKSRPETWSEVKVP